VETDKQAILLDMPEQPEVVGRKVTAPARLKLVDREQLMFARICVEELIGPDHHARAIWELTGRLDLSRFEEPLKTRQGAAGGRPAWEPRLLVSMVYAYSEGISSAREIERLMEWEPGLQWLGGLETVNHHTLSDFPVEHREALNELFVQLLPAGSGQDSRSGLTEGSLLHHFAEPSGFTSISYNR
jgi:transposase